METLPGGRNVQPAFSLTATGYELTIRVNDAFWFDPGSPSATTALDRNISNVLHAVRTALYTIGTARAPQQ